MAILHFFFHIIHRKLHIFACVHTFDNKVSLSISLTLLNRCPLPASLVACPQPAMRPRRGGAAARSRRARLAEPPICGRPVLVLLKPASSYLHARFFTLFATSIHLEWTWKNVYKPCVPMYAIWFEYNRIFELPSKPVCSVWVYIYFFVLVFEDAHCSALLW